MTGEQLTIGASDRVGDYVDQFRRFLADEVAPLERDLEAARVGTPAQPHLDDAGRMPKRVGPLPKRGRPPTT